jgi:hypothetical protein
VATPRSNQLGGGHRAGPPDRGLLRFRGGVGGHLDPTAGVLRLSLSCGDVQEVAICWNRELLGGGGDKSRPFSLSSRGPGI